MKQPVLASSHGPKGDMIVREENDSIHSTSLSTKMICASLTQNTMQSSTTNLLTDAHQLSSNQHPSLEEKGPPELEEREPNRTKSTEPHKLEEKEMEPQEPEAMEPL